MQMISLLSFFFLLQNLVGAFYFSNRCLRPYRASLRQTTRNAGPLDFLSGLFKDSKITAAEKLESAKKLTDSLVLITKSTSNGIKASPEVRSEVSKLVKDLEALNSVKTISSSPVMDGNWRLIYTTNNGSSAGVLGPFVGRVDQNIDVTSNKYINYVRLGSAVQGALSATWDNLGPKLWRVKFIDVTISIFGIPVQKKSLEGSIGIWRMTYLDDSIRILYAQGGKNTVTENIYILSKDKL
jgi:hypothetical protein